MQQLLVDELTGDRVILAPGARAAARHVPRARRAAPGERRDLSVLPRQRARDPARGRAPRRRARPTRRAGRCASSRTSTRSSATASPGAHEVVIFSPAHDADLGALSDDGGGRRAARAARPRALPPRRRLSVRAGLRQPGQGRGRVDRASARAARRARLRARRARRRGSIASRRPRSTTTRQHRVVDGAVVVLVPARVADAVHACGSRSPTAAPRFDEATDDDARAVGGRVARRDRGDRVGARRRRLQRHGRDRARAITPRRSAGGSTSFPASPSTAGFELAHRPVGQHRRARRRGRARCERAR